MAILNYIKEIHITSIKDESGATIGTGEYSPVRVIEGASYSEGDISHNYTEAETSNNPLFDSPSQDSSVFTFDVADMTDDLMKTICGATYNSATGYKIPAIFPSRKADVKIVLRKDGVNGSNAYILLTECTIVAKQVGENLKTDLWRVSIECTVTGDKFINGI